MIELLIEAERAMSFQRIDRAEALYRQVVAGDPRNAIAVVGLARVALERGEEVDALSLARDALAIDPENDKARRLAERLEEILHARGVAVPAGPTSAEAAVEVPPVPPAPPDRPEPTERPKPPERPERPVQAPRKRSLFDRLRRRDS